MASIMVQFCKYLILFLFLAYVFAGLYSFKKVNNDYKNAGIYITQRVLLYLIHFLGYLCLYQHNPEPQLIGFYLMQVVIISGIFLLYRVLYRNCSVVLLNHMCMCLVIGLIFLTRLSFAKGFRQFIFISIGAIAMLLIPLFLQKGERFRRLSVLYGAGGMVLLGSVVLLGSTDYGAKLNIAIGEISFQPSEFVKIVFVFFVASMLYNNNSIKRLLITSVLSAIFVLELVAAKDLGGALIYFMAFMIMVYVATRQKRYLFIGSIGMSFAAVLGYFMFSHVRTRVFAWLDPLADIDNRGYQICQSLFGIGTGGWFGFGIGEGLPGKIPVVDKDFIFSAIAEEQGVFFSIGVILLCASCFMLIVNVAMQMKDRFYKLVAIGLATLYATQVILTIGGAIKFIPSTGVTLPLISYGGSSMLATLCIFGIVQGLYMRQLREQEGKTVDGKEFSVVFWIFGSVFLAMIIYLTGFMLFRSEKFINNDYNKLQTLFEEDIKRGDIISADGHLLAQTVTGDDGTDYRRYPYGSMFSHVIGYSADNKTGLEKMYNFELLRSHAFLGEQLLCDLSGTKKPGDALTTTLRYDLQSVAYEALGDYDGAIVVLEPSTGKILAMVSKPDYDPNTLNDSWEELQQGTKLYPRATMGSYAPGSTFKLFTALAYIRSNPSDYENYSYECKGEITVDGKTVHCAGKIKHGKLNMTEAMQVSCNTFFISMLDKIDIDIFQQLCEEKLFNTNLPVEIESKKSSFLLDNHDTTAVKMDTLIGQGKTLVSPLHMAMLAGAVCNDGVMMTPVFAEEISTYKGFDVSKEKTTEYKEVFSKEEAALLTYYMEQVVENGNASKLQSEKYKAYGKTGTAQTTSDLKITDAWFVGFAECEGKELAIAVVVEDSGTGTKYAVPIAKKIFDVYFQ